MPKPQRELHFAAIHQFAFAGEKKIYTANTFQIVELVGNRNVNQNDWKVTTERSENYVSEVNRLLAKCDGCSLLAIVLRAK